MFLVHHGKVNYLRNNLKMTFLSTAMKGRDSLAQASMIRLSA